MNILTSPAAAHLHVPPTLRELEPESLPEQPSRQPTGRAQTAAPASPDGSTSKQELWNFALQLNHQRHQQRLLDTYASASGIETGTSQLSGTLTAALLQQSQQPTVPLPLPAARLQQRTELALGSERQSHFLATA
ncbi:hypothetical protein [Motiliproteus sediminis]|uniref:hypothetical protein n=1 Tax=Motiliproteus sediminis TaxID=1468178 RepID=UPI001AEF3870|nr:hypothetical protein [Motiliproteus sediminis]